MATHAILYIGESGFTGTLNPKPVTKRRPGRPRKAKTTMATTQTTPAVSSEPTVPTKNITLTVFDLATFDDVKLSKNITLPSKPTTLEEALAACGNDSAKLLDVIHEGLIAETVDRAREDMSGFMQEGEDGEDVPYTGAFADEKKSKLINNAVLALAKINGYGKTLAPTKKRELKDRAKNFLRENPAMLASLQS